MHFTNNLLFLKKYNKNIKLGMIFNDKNI
jgi:hypothetical protein